MKIRTEQPQDYLDVENLIAKAFQTVKESDHREHLLVQRLRKTTAFIPQLSLVGEKNGEIIGHILFSHIEINDGENKYASLALAPLAVLPKYQHLGVGSSLMNEGLKHAKMLGFCSVIVLGYPDYYKKFGFDSASNWNITAPFDVPKEVFMALELTENGLKNVSGEVVYHSTFFE